MFWVYYFGLSQYDLSAKILSWNSNQLSNWADNCHNLLKTQDQRDKLVSLEQQAKKTISKLSLHSVMTIICPIAELI